MRKPLFIDIWIVLAVTVFISSYVGLFMHEAIKANTYAVNKWNEYGKTNWSRYDKLISKGNLSKQEFLALEQMGEEILSEMPRKIKFFESQYLNDNKGEFWILFIGINILFNSAMRFISRKLYCSPTHSAR